MKGTQVTTVSVRELKAKASQILRELESSGEEVIVTRRGKPCAKLVRLTDQATGKKSLRTLRGALPSMPDELTWDDFMEAKKIWEPRPLPGPDE